MMEIQVVWSARIMSAKVRTGLAASIAVVFFATTESAADGIAAGLGATLGFDDLAGIDGVAEEEFIAEGFAGDEVDPVFSAAAEADASLGAGDCAGSDKEA